MGKRYSKKQRRNSVERVNAIKETGVNQVEACKQANVCHGSYIAWAKSYRKSPKAIKVIAPTSEYAPQKTYTPDTKCVVIVTTTTGLSSVLRQL